MRPHGTISVFAASVALALFGGFGSSSVGASGRIKSQSVDTVATSPDGVVGLVAPLHITRRVEARLIGSPPAVWTLTRVAMATTKIGWAAATGLGSAAQPRLALATTDGGKSFSPLFAAPESNVGLSAPDAKHAYCLEGACENGGGCSSIGPCPVRWTV